MVLLLAAGDGALLVGSGLALEGGGVRVHAEEDGAVLERVLLLGTGLLGLGRAGLAEDRLDLLRVDDGRDVGLRGK